MFFGVVRKIFLPARACVVAVAALFACVHAWAQAGLAGANEAANSVEPGGAVAVQERICKVFADNKDSVVKVFAQKERDFGGDIGVKMKLDVGSGVLVSKDGHVMTSAFVVYDSKKIWVEWRGILLAAKLVGADPLTTTAIIKIDGNFKDKNPNIVHMNTSGDLAPVGAMLVSVSYEMGLPAAPRFGLASGYNIEFGGAFLPTVYMRTTIPSYNGGTGGAVFDLDGNFAGLTIASLPEIGGSFLLPAKAAARIRDDIILCGEPVYSWFGLRAEDRDFEDGTHVVVNLVAENGPAKRAGFKPGDVILEVCGKAVQNNTQMRAITFFVRPGEVAKFKVLRDGKIVRLDLIAEKMDSEIVKSAEKGLKPDFGENSVCAAKQGEKEKSKSGAAKGGAGVSEGGEKVLK